jgi:hypothetical protein
MKEETMTELTDALRELLEAYEARYPNAEAGMDAQTAWVMRQSRAREVARSLLASQAKQAGQTEPMEHGQARQVLDVGFKFENGVHTPTVLVGFAVNDWNARDAFAAALALPAPIEQITPENTDGVKGLEHG